MNFGTIEVIAAMELGGRINAEDAYQMIKDELKEVKNVVNSLRKMDADDGLKVIQNEDKTFTLEWDKEDPKWSFLNNLTSKEITAIIEEAVRMDENGPLSERLKK